MLWHEANWNDGSKRSRVKLTVSPCRHVPAREQFDSAPVHTSVICRSVGATLQAFGGGVGVGVGLGVGVGPPGVGVGVGVGPPGDPTVTTFWALLFTPSVVTVRCTV